MSAENQAFAMTIQEIYKRHYNQAMKNAQKAASLEIQELLTSMNKPVSIEVTPTPKTDKEQYIETLTSEATELLNREVGTVVKPKAVKPSRKRKEVVGPCGYKDRSGEGCGKPAREVPTTGKWNGVPMCSKHMGNCRPRCKANGCTKFAHACKLHNDIVPEEITCVTIHPPPVVAQTPVVQTPVVVENKESESVAQPESFEPLITQPEPSELTLHNSPVTVESKYALEVGESSYEQLGEDDDDDWGDNNDDEETGNMPSCLDAFANLGIGCDDEDDGCGNNVDQNNVEVLSELSDDDDDENDLLL